jgi:hypothetical protein
MAAMSAPRLENTRSVSTGTPTVSHSPVRESRAKRTP